MNRPLIAAALLLTALAITRAPAARAETFCVEDSGHLVWTLNRVGMTPEADVIRLRTGTYTTANVGGFGAMMEGSLEISGGWSAGCLFRQRGARSTIDGEYQRPGLLIVAPQLTFPNTLRIAHMTFRRNIGDDRGGLKIRRSGGAPFSVVVEDSRFIDNHLTDHLTEVGAGLFVEADNIHVLGNVFSGNDATYDAAAAHLACTGTNAAFNANTVTANTVAFGQSGKTGGVMLRGCQWEAINNILWGSEGDDLNVLSTPARVRFNNIGSATGLSWLSGNNLSVDPQFAGASSLRLRRSSPLIDAGQNEATQGLPLLSHDGGPRLAGPAIDMGAYELETLFANDFDPLILIPNP